MDVVEAREFVRQNSRAVLATLRRDGRAQVTPVMVGVEPGGRLDISSSEVTAKVRNLRRDPRASLSVLTERFYGPHVQIYGRAEIVSLPEAMELLVAYYRQLAGEHPNWEEYREAMVKEQRCLIRITIEQAVG
jgi:PPOX class probable F420-dependent enzyme